MIAETAYLKILTSHTPKHDILSCVIRLQRPKESWLTLGESKEASSRSNN